MTDVHAISLGSIDLPECAECDALPGGSELNDTLCSACRLIVLSTASERNANAITIVLERDFDEDTATRSAELRRKPRP